MSDNDNEMPVEVVNLSYIRLGDDYAIRFTLHGVPQQLVLVPRIDSIELISVLYKAIMVVADPVGPCVNEQPY